MPICFTFKTTTKSNTKAPALNDVGVFILCYTVNYSHKKGKHVPRLRADQQTRPMKKFTVYVYAETVEELNRTADAKGITRNALITQLLAKATKTTKRKEGE